MKPFLAISYYLIAIGLVCIATNALTADRQVASNGGTNSGCVQCHTNVKKLIRLSWEVERIRGRPAVSAQIEGEG